MKRIVSTLATGAAALSLLLFAACDSAPAAGDGSNPSASQQGPSPFRAADYAEAAPGKPGGTLKISTYGDPTSLDLHSISHANAQWLGRMIYDNLVYLDAQGKIVPWLATSWDISPDGKIYTFHLREGVTFSDGSKFDAAAVKANLEHMRAPATKSPLAAAYIAPYIDGRVVSEYVFEATLREPYTPFLHVLAQSWLSMESPRAIKEQPEKLGQFPVGSGPFIVESYTRQQGIRLVRRKDYNWSPPQLNHKGPAYVERIEIDFVPEQLIRYNTLLTGQYDITMDAPPQNAAAIRNDPALVFDTRVRTGSPMRGLSFNIDKAPFDDVRVRRALAIGLDRDGIAKVVGFGEYQSKTDFLAANTRYYDPSFQDVLRYDPAQANKLLDEAGWTARDAAGYRTKDGKRLGAEVLLSTNLQPSPMYAALQADARKLGVELTVTQLPTGQITDRRAAGNYQAMFAGVWHTNTPDALFINYHSGEITSPKRIGQNTAHLRDAQLDEALVQGRTAQDSEVAKAAYSKAQQRLTELVPAIPLYENYSSVAYSKRVKGVVYDTSHNTLFIPSLWLEAK
ncbi:ABC transporter substrate-binding protein [Duganella sp. PWIR1]